MNSKKYEIEKFGVFCEGVARDDGKTVFVKGALPGEVVFAKPTLIKKSFNKAKLVKVISPSKDRTPPQCAYFDVCGGCSLQHLSYEAQLEYKKQAVEETLKKVGGIEAEVNEIVASDKIFRYRNKLSFPVREKKIGLYEESSHFVVDINDCLLQREWNKPLIKALRSFMTDYKLTGYDEQKGDIRHIVAREKGGSICITLVTTKRIRIDGFLRYIPYENFALYQNVNSKNNNVILSDEFYLVGGKGKYPDFHPASFYQVNDYIEDRLYSDVLNECEGDTVIDAYCGAGNLTLQIASKAQFVYGIEICKQAVDEANNKANKLRALNVEFICGDCRDEFPSISDKVQGNVTVLFDPPRKGVDEKTLKATLALAPQRIVYVSCNPATLARDLKILTSAYTVEKIKAYDMFPMTPHVETIVCLSRRLGIQ